MSDVGYGTPPRADDPWGAMAAELTPDRSLIRVAASARTTATSVTVVGSVLTAAGLVATGELLPHPVSAWLARSAVGVAFVAVVLALAYVSVSIDRVNPRNLAAVEAYARRQFRRARLAVWAGRLLVVAVVLGGAAAVVALLPAGVAAQLQLAGSVDGATTSISGKAEVTSLRENQVVTVRVLARGPRGPRLVYSSRATPDVRGVVSVDAADLTVARDTICDLDVAVDDVAVGSLTLTPPPAP